MDYQDRSGLKWKELARAIGIASTTLSQIVNGTYPGRWQKHIVDIDKWLEEELKRERAPKPTEFVRTNVAEAVYTVADAASTLKGIGLVYGWAGVGKTTALQAIVADKPGSVFVSMKTAKASPMGVLHAIAAAIGLRDSYNNKQRELTDRLEQLLRGTPRLIVIDEIHKLCGSKDDKALHVLRDLHDATGVPMLWSGTIDLVRYLERGQAAGREPLAQIRSRICVARDLNDTAGTGGGDEGDTLYTIDEIRRVFAKSKMRMAPDAARYLWKLANLPDSGALRTCKNLVIMATKINSIGGAGVLTADMLRDAQQLLVSRRDYATLQSTLQDTRPRPLAKVG